MEAREKIYYQSLYEMAAALNSSHAPEAILQSVVEGVAKAMEAKGKSKKGVSLGVLITSIPRIGEKYCLWMGCSLRTKRTGKIKSIKTITFGRGQV
jgi:hypothetical protein